MKRIHCLTLLLTALLLSAFTADAYKVTFRWDLPESAMIKIGGMGSSYSPEELSTGQNEYTYESTSSSWLYIIAKEGYRIVSATAPDNSQLEPMFSTTAAADGGSGSYWGKFMTDSYLSGFGQTGDAVFNFVIEPIERNSSFTVNVENGAANINASFSGSGYSVPLENGLNTVNFLEGFDTDFLLECKGVDSFYSVTLNAAPVEKDKYWARYNLSAVKDGDSVNVRVYEGEEPVVEDVTITLNIPESLSGAINSVRDWTMGEFVSFEDNKLTVAKGTDIGINFNEGYSFTKFTYAGTDITDRYTESYLRLRWNVESSGELEIEGSPIEFGTVDFTAFVENPEGVILYQGTYLSNPADLAGGETVGADVELDGMTLTAANSRKFCLPVPANTPHVYVAPRDGWYIATVQGTVDGTMTIIPNANQADGTTTFYVIARKLTESASVEFDVLKSPDTNLVFKGNTSMASIWDNPQREFTLKEGTQEVKFIPGYDNPFSLRPLETVADFAVCLDGAILPIDEENGTVTIDPYCPKSGSEQTLQSSVKVYADGTLPGTCTVKYTSTDMQTTLLYSPVMHEGSSNIKLLYGTQAWLVPGSASCLIKMNDEVVHGTREDGTSVNGLDAEGRYAFTVPEAKALTFTIISQASRLLDIESIDPADGSTVKSIKTVKISIPMLDSENMLYSDAEHYSKISLVKEGSEHLYGAELGEVGMSPDERCLIYPISFQAAVEEAGEYTLSIPAGTFYEAAWSETAGDYVAVENGLSTSALTAVITVDPDMKSKMETYTITPRSGSCVSPMGLMMVSIDFTEYGMTDIFRIDPSAQIAFYAENGQTVDAGAEISWEGESCRRINILPSEQLTDGKWTMVVNAGAFSFEGESSPEIVAEYTIDSEAPDYPIWPAPGSTITDASEFIIEFPGAYDVEFTGSTFDFMLTNGGTYASPGMDCEPVEGKSNAFRLTLPEGAQTPPMGKLQLIINEGAFELDGTPSSMISATYTLEHQVSTDWTATPENTIVIDDFGINWGFVFDESAVVSIADRAGISVRINDEEVTGYEIMAENNYLLMGIYDMSLLEAGTLSVTVEAGAIKLSGASGPAIEYSWQLLENKTFSYEVSPSGGGIADDLSKITVRFPEATSVDVFNPYGATLRGQNNYICTATVTVVENAEVPTVELTFNPAPTEDDAYTLQCMQGAFVLDEVFESPSIEVVYNLVTGIDMIGIDADTPVTVVTVDGRVLYRDTPAGSIRDLEKGIYIINGRKTLIK